MLIFSKIFDFLGLTAAMILLWPSKARWNYILGVVLYTLCHMIFMRNTDIFGFPEFWLELLRQVSCNIFHNEYHWKFYV